jgi:hypothetical protein
MNDILETNYFVYYDKKTNHILSVTNEIHAVFEDKITVSPETYERLVTGVDKFSDYRVGQTADGATELVSIIKEQYCFNYKLLTMIKDTPDINTNLVVEWHEKTKVWKFCLSKFPQGELPHMLMIFATLNNDYDFLIRKFEIDVDQLIKGPMYIPFDNKFELQIENVSIFTKTNALSYGLRVIHE